MQKLNVQLSIQNFLAICGIILFAVVLRLLPHPPNIAPIAALALFGGVYMDRRVAFVLPLLVMFFSDIFLGFNQSTPFVYLSFFLTVGIGMWIRKHKSCKTIALGTLLSSILFFLITNFGYWLTFSLYPKTLDGQMLAYVNALPFFRNSLLGDFFYTGVFFGSFELIKAIVNTRSIVFIKKQ